MRNASTPNRRPRAPYLKTYFPDTVTVGSLYVSPSSSCKCQFGAGVCFPASTFVLYNQGKYNAWLIVIVGLPLSSVVLVTEGGPYSS
jgi:hypothetical protein